ncbi:MAG: hypothetical protein MJZ37_00645 [Bacilli bacterium]|nr:hypothetical protein [Bacilli bacterium]
MTVLIEKEGQVKQIQTEDLSFYLKRGWIKSDKKEVPTTYKRGRKRPVEKTEVEE